MTTALELWFYIALGVLALVAGVGGAIAAVRVLKNLGGGGDDVERHIANRAPCLFTDAAIGPRQDGKSGAWEGPPSSIKFPPDYQRPTGKQRERCRRKVESAFSLRDDPTRKDNHRL